MKGAIVFLLLSPALALAQGEGAGRQSLDGSGMAPWLARTLSQRSSLGNPIREGNRPREGEADWWDTLPAEDRKYIARGEYENPYALIEARKRQEQYSRQAREAVARGEAPPIPPKPLEGGDRIARRPASEPLRQVPPGPPSLPRLLRDLVEPSAVRAPGWYTSWAGFSDNWRPSDSVAAVGPAHVGVMVNSTLAFYTKNGAAAVAPLPLSAWWPDAPHPGDLYDPKIIYDPHAGRWVMLALNGRNGDAETYFAISVSQTQNPELGWWNYYLRSDIDGGSDTTNWADYPGLGFDSGDATASASGGAIYIASNQYNGGTFQRGKIRILPKHQLYNNAGCCGWYDFWNSSVFTWKPAATATSTGASPIEYLINTSSIGGSTLTQWTLTNPLALGGPPSLSSASIGSNVYGPPPSADQPGGYLIDTGDCRTQDVQYRNGYLYVTAGDFSFWSDLFDTDAVVHYWKIHATSGAVAWDSYFGSNDESFSYGKVLADAANNATFIFSHTSPGAYPEIGMTGRTPADGGVQSYLVLKQGEAVFNPTSDNVERWGDYNGLGIDCAGDEAGMWGMSQYARSDGWWQSWIGGTSFGAPNVWHLADSQTAAASSGPRSYTWKLESYDWSAVALSNPGGGDNDLAASATCPFGNAYQNSYYGGATPEFIVANGSAYGAAYHHAKATNYSGPGSFLIQARTISQDVAVGQAWPESIGAGELIDLFEASLAAGKTYAAVIDLVSGNADLDVWTFRGARFNGRRADNDGSSQNPGALVDEALVFTAGESSNYGFLVLNENAGASDYVFRIWLKPSLSPIPAATIPAGSAYTGPTPSLAEGTTPVAWSLVSGPTGMTINPASGVVNWPNPLAGLATVTIRATNPAGSSDASWSLTVLAAPTGTPTQTPTLTPIPTRTPTAPPANTSTPGPSGIPTETSTSTPPEPPTPSPSSTETPTPTPSPSQTPPEPTATATIASERATLTPTPPPTPSSTPFPTKTPTMSPFSTPTPTSTSPGIPLPSSAAGGLAPILGALLCACVLWLRGRAPGLAGKWKRR